MNAIEGHLIFGYADGEDKPGKEIQLVPGVIKKASRVSAGIIQKLSPTLKKFPP